MGAEECHLIMLLFFNFSFSHIFHANTNRVHTSTDGAQLVHVVALEM